MFKLFKIVSASLIVVGVIAIIVLLFNGSSVAVLNPQGVIAAKERDLMYFALLLSLFVVIPVFALTIGIAWRYREGNTKSHYTPNWDHNVIAEVLWWLIPLVLILILAVTAWRSSHELDPFKPINSEKKAIVIQVVALEWKWLFIYPDQKVASVNSVNIPVGHPVKFEITSDAPMNSFWVPQLGGQVYAMSGMSTQLHLRADAAGDYRGVSANLSGKGFSEMDFMVHATDEKQFEEWVAGAKQSSASLTTSKYEELMKPSQNNKTSTYTLGNDKLYEYVLNKFMPEGSGEMLESK